MALTQPSFLRGLAGPDPGGGPLFGAPWIFLDSPEDSPPRVVVSNPRTAVAPHHVSPAYKFGSHWAPMPFDTAAYLPDTKTFGKPLEIVTFSDIEKTVPVVPVCEPSGILEVGGVARFETGIARRVTAAGKGLQGRCRTVATVEAVASLGMGATAVAAGEEPAGLSGPVASAEAAASVAAAAAAGGAPAGISGGSGAAAAVAAAQGGSRSAAAAAGGAPAGFSGGPGAAAAVAAAQAGSRTAAAAAGGAPAGISGDSGAAAAVAAAQAAAHSRGPGPTWTQEAARGEPAHRQGGAREAARVKGPGPVWTQEALRGEPAQWQEAAVLSLSAGTAAGDFDVPLMGGH